MAAQDTPALTPQNDAPAAKPRSSDDRASGDRVFASPLARRIAADKGLDLARITGSGPRGRIVKADVENASPVATASVAASSAVSVPAPAATDPNSVIRMYQDRAYTEVPLDGMRKVIAARLTPDGALVTRDMGPWSPGALTTVTSC